MQTHPVHRKYVRAHAASKRDRLLSAEKLVDEEWWRRTSISSAWARLLDILFVGGQEAIPPVRCAPPSPVLRPRSRISRCFCSFAAPRACLCRPLPLRPRASDIARAGKKVAPDPHLHAGAARAASRPRQRRRGRLGRGRLIALPRRPRRWAASGGLFLRPPASPLACGRVPTSSRCLATLAATLATLATLAVRWAVRWAVRSMAPRGACGGEGGAPQRRACGDGAAHGRGRAAGARPSRAHRAGRAALAWVAARALYVCRVFPARARCAVACGGRADRRSASAERPPRVTFANGFCTCARVHKFRLHGPRTRSQMYCSRIRRPCDTIAHRYTPYSCAPHAACCCLAAQITANDACLNMVTVAESRRRSALVSTACQRVLLDSSGEGHAVCTAASAITSISSRIRCGCRPARPRVENPPKE